MFSGKQPFQRVFSVVALEWREARQVLQFSHRYLARTAFKKYNLLHWGHVHEQTSLWGNMSKCAWTSTQSDPKDGFVLNIVLLNRMLDTEQAGPYRSNRLRHWSLRSLSLVCGRLKPYVWPLLSLNGLNAVSVTAWLHVARQLTPHFWPTNKYSIMGSVIYPSNKHRIYVSIIDN